MTTRRFLRNVLRWIAALVGAVLVVMLIRGFCVESYRISTGAMEEALHKGDYILVNKLPEWRMPERGKVMLFTSPLAKDSVDAPLFISRCIGMPGDTILVDEEGYTVNGVKMPRSPRSLRTYFVTKDAWEVFHASLQRLDLPERDLKEERFGYTLSLTTFEEYLLREELPEEVSRHFIGERTQAYQLIVPKKDRAYALDAASLTACKEIILDETGGSVYSQEGKFYRDGQEVSFFFFHQDYYWMLSDNANEGVDSRHLGFIPADRMVGTAWCCWYSPEDRRLFKPVN